MCTYNRLHLFATTIYMWIGSRICLTARQPYASPPGYQSPASGDNVPDPGSQDIIGAPPHHGSAPPHHGSAPPTRYNNNDTLTNSAPYLSHSSVHQEDANASSVSQWWGHHGLHQDEVLECKSSERTRKVSLIDRICQLTSVPRHSVAPSSLVSNEVMTNVDQAIPSSHEPSLVRNLTASEGSDLTRLGDDSLSSITLTSTGPLNEKLRLSLPNYTSYARCCCTSDYQPQNLVDGNSPARTSLTDINPEQLSLY